MVVVQLLSYVRLLKPHARLLCSWDSLGKNTGMGCHFLLQEIFLTQESNPGLLHCRWILNQLSYKGSLKFRQYVLSNTLHSILQKFKPHTTFMKVCRWFLSFFLSFLAQTFNFWRFFWFVCFCCSYESTCIMFFDLEEHIFQISHFTVNTCV